VAAAIARVDEATKLAAGYTLGSVGAWIDMDHREALAGKTGIMHGAKKGQGAEGQAGADAPFSPAM
jgi:hypothetical protein